MHNGELASIHSSLQQAFLTAEAAKFADEVSWFFCLSSYLCFVLPFQNLFSIITIIFSGMELLDWLHFFVDVGNILLVR